MKKADGPVDSHKCHRQNRVVHKGEPKIFSQFRFETFSSYTHTTPLASVKTLLLLVPHIVSSEASFTACKKVEEEKPPVIEIFQRLQLNLLIHSN